MLTQQELLALAKQDAQFHIDKTGISLCRPPGEVIAQAFTLGGVWSNVQSHWNSSFHLSAGEALRLLTFLETNKDALTRQAHEELARQEKLLLDIDQKVNAARLACKNRGEDSPGPAHDTVAEQIRRRAEEAAIAGLKQDSQKYFGGTP